MMIAFISSWAQGIVVAIVIATIIEMILPEGNSKKYIKIVVGVFILYNIVTPVITKVSGGKMDLSQTVSSYLKEVQTQEVGTQNLENTNSSSIKEIYLSQLGRDITAKLEVKGYKTEKIALEAKDDENYTITKLKLKVHKQEIKKEEPVSNKIEVSLQINEIVIGEKQEEKTKETELSKKEVEEIKSYIKETYEIKENLISLE